MFRIVQFAANDGAGLPHDFSESVGVSSSNAAPPADYGPLTCQTINEPTMRREGDGDTPREVLLVPREPS